MKSYTKHIILNTNKRIDIINITDKINESIQNSKIREGFCLVNAMHITASVFVNDKESGLKEDIMEWLNSVAPDKEYEHHKTGEDNGPAHLKNLLMHHQVIIPSQMENLTGNHGRRYSMVSLTGKEIKE